MGLSFAYPLALWGLIGLPLIVAIHFLQSRNRHEEVSSLFLLELLPEETRSGAVFSYLRNGVQLWMQLLAVLLFTLILARPMWLHQESRQSVAVVLDSSVSMRAFTAELMTGMESLSADLTRSAGKTEWWVLPSDPGRPGLAQAADRDQFLQALEKFEALSGPHSPRNALQRARQLVGPEGLVFLVSDHVAEDLPAGALAISVGRPLENSGFTGIRFEGGGWQASVIHFGKESVQKTVTIQFDDQLPEERLLTLNPGAVTLLSGPLPSEFKHARLRLEDDATLWDNALPFVSPLETPLAYGSQLKDPGLTAWVEKLMQTVSGAVASGTPQLSWREGWPVREVPDSPAEIWWLNGEESAGFSLVAATEDPLTADLNWDGFLALPFKGFLMRPEDEVLLWMGAEPLVIRRPGQTGTRLLMNFDFDTSNAERFPSMLLLLHRFAKTQRDLQPLPCQTQLETRQQLPFPIKAEGPFQTTFMDLHGQVQTREVATGPELRVPDRPGIWTVKQGEDLILKAGVFAGDVAEGNFSQARPLALPETLVLAQRQRNSQSDFLLPLWFLLLALTLGLSWWSEKRGRG